LQTMPLWHPHHHHYSSSSRRGAGGNLPHHRIPNQILTVRSWSSSSSLLQRNHQQQQPQHHKDRIDACAGLERNVPEPLEFYQKYSFPRSSETTGSYDSVQDEKHRSTSITSSIVKDCFYGFYKGLWNTVLLQFVHIWYTIEFDIIGSYCWTDHVDCSDGVLHVPPPPPPPAMQQISSSRGDVTASEGIQKSWFIECHPPHGATLVNNTHATCIALPSSPQQQQQCFRGVHDSVVSERQVREALVLGGYLIGQGGDHFDIHYSVGLLEERLGPVVSKLRDLLLDRYHVAAARPVAYRVNAVGPRNGEGVHLYGMASKAMSNHLTRVLNRTRYAQWMDRAARRNELARFPLPWPLRNLVPPPIRDVCILLADLDANNTFAYQTTVFLSSSNIDYQGGAALYVDHDDELYRRRKDYWKIRRGILVDGYLGRVIVNTGGRENRRCRLPVHSGIRATLQIWWDNV
jgi:hypothetical protein